MKKTFTTSFRLRNNYRVNSIIYSIKGIPFVRNILPDSLYQNKGLKILGTIISILWEIGSTFIGKLLYLFFMIFLMLPLFPTDKGMTFLHLFVFLTYIGGLMNTYMFNPTKDKYYGIILMHMDAKKYALSNYYYALGKVLIGFLPFTILFGLMIHLPLWICIALPIFVILVKVSVLYYNIYYFEKTGIANNENLPMKALWVIIGLCLAFGYGLPFVGITISFPLFIILFLLNLFLGIFSFIKINKFQKYDAMYKQLLTFNNVYMVNKEASTQLIKENVSNQIVYDARWTSNKKGFAYFHELFVKRHSKILTKAVKKQFIVIFFIFVFLSCFVLFNKDIGKRMNSFALTYLPYFVFIMYMLNRGTSLTQAMFMNCDHSMLSYRIYRTPKILLGVFKERLKTLILINLLPAMMIAIGLPLLLYLTGGTDNSLNYFILFFSILAMSIFFSVHYLVMYYLLQPYNVQTEMKNSTYQIVQTITYIVCYYMLQIKLPTLSFGIATIIFSILYSLISLILVYRLAPKTFKLRL